MTGARLIRLDAISAERGFAWVCQLPSDLPLGDGPDDGHRSVLRLFEDGLELGPGHSLHEDIRRVGGGRYSHWGNALYFSSSDNAAAIPKNRTYFALVESGASQERQQVMEAARSVDLDQLSAEERYWWGERLFSLFVSDAKLSEYGRSLFHEEEFLTDYELFDRQNYRGFDRKFAAKELLKLVLPLDGDVAECGVFRGATAYILAKALRSAGVRKQVHLFDSFEGLSRPQAVDGAYWSAGALACSLDEVRKNLAVFEDVVSYHPGWVPTGFSTAADRRFCFVHIDVDLYQPTWDSLEFFYPRMMPGGLILCDDYGFETCPGARTAMDEFFKRRGNPVIHLPTGQGFVQIGSTQQ